MTAADKVREEKEKNYKTPHDVERLHHIAAAMVHLRDHSSAAPLMASLGREVKAMTLKQMDLDAKEREEEAHASMPEPMEGNDSSPPTRAPSVPRR